MKRKLTAEQLTAIINSKEFQDHHRERIKGFLSMYKKQFVPLDGASGAFDKFKHVKPDLSKPYPGNNSQ